MQAVIRNISRKLLLIGSAVLILGLGIGIGSSLGVPGLSGANANGAGHHACVSTYTGQMRYAYDPSQCKSNEYPISWSQQGTSNYELVQGDPIPVAVGETKIERLVCPGGKQILGGGGIASYIAETNPAAAEPTMFWSFPFDEHSWQIAVNNDTNQAQEMRAYAICANIGA